MAAITQIEVSYKPFRISKALGRDAGDAVRSHVFAQAEFFELNARWAGSNYLGALEVAARKAYPDYVWEIKGKKRYTLVDTVGLLLHAIVHPANTQDLDGAILVLGSLFGKFPFLKKLFTDGGYQGPIFECAQINVFPHLKTEIVKRSDAAVGFEVIPRRWIVERTFAWLERRCRIAKGFENRSRTARAFLLWVSIRLMFKKICFNKLTF